MQENTLVIMAAGLGSRYKGGIKQMDGVGPNGEWIMDYSIYDAYQAGIRKVILIIRSELKELMKEHFSNLPMDLEIVYVLQEVTDLPSGFSFPERKKPWGTGHAILCCQEEIKGPFIVINADDYYGKTIFYHMNAFLNQQTEDFCMGGYFLKNTLSENGGVNRGICTVDSNLHLIDIDEVYQIEKLGDRIEGKRLDDTIIDLDMNGYCSLNCWGFTLNIFAKLQAEFLSFLKQTENIEKAEFLLPNVVKHMIKDNEVKMQVLPTNDEWFGMTYQEDKEKVKMKIQDHIKEGKYPEQLWKKI